MKGVLVTSAVKKFIRKLNSQLGKNQCIPPCLDQWPNGSGFSVDITCGNPETVLISRKRLTAVFEPPTFDKGINRGGPQRKEVNEDKSLLPLSKGVGGISSP